MHATRQMLLKMGASAGVALTGPVAPDFQGCGYSDPDHSWDGFLVQHNGGRMDGFLLRPTPVVVENPATRVDLRFHAACWYWLISPASTVRRLMRSAGVGKGSRFGSSSGARSRMPWPWCERPVL